MSTDNSKILVIILPNLRVYFSKGKFFLIK